MMKIIQQGTGEPLVLIPGIQGKWEYLSPAVDALSQSFRVITFPLRGEPTSGLPLDGSRGFESCVEQLIAILDVLRVARATICGVSFGGLIALRFAAAHPDRARALVLASTPGPTWRLRKRHALYARLPWIFGPLFLAEAPRRLRHELGTAFPDPAARRRFVRSQLRMLATVPLSLARMARRALMISSADLAAQAERVVTPTLVITGEPGLDYVVPVEGSSDYLRLIRGARAVTLERTGHLGPITRPEAFAAVILEFLASLEPESPRPSPAPAAVAEVGSPRRT